MYKLAESIVAIPKLTLGKYLSEGPKAANAVASDVTSVAKIVPTGDITSIGKYLSTTPAVKDATSVANTTLAAPKVTTSISAVLPDLKLFGNTTTLNGGKNKYYDNIDIYEAKIGGHVYKGTKDFLENLHKANNDFFSATGKNFYPSSGSVSSFRTYDDQLRLYKDLKPRGGAVANPNDKWANHMHGNAADLGGQDGSWKIYTPYLAKYNLYNNEIVNDAHHTTYRPKKVK